MNADETHSGHELQKRRAIVVKMHGGTIESVSTNIPGLDGADVIFTEGLKYLEGENETEVGDSGEGIYTVHALGTPESCDHVIIAADIYGERQQ